MVGQIALTCKYFGVNILGYIRDQLTKLGHKMGRLGETTALELERAQSGFELSQVLAELLNFPLKPIKKHKVLIL